MAENNTTGLNTENIIELFAILIEFAFFMFLYTFILWFVARVKI